ncbi:MAG: transcriptional regulator GlxA family with amidase domain [Myxococcota bacterium]|jgi:transcriptional regulator GlxA family with amidase domain
MPTPHDILALIGRAVRDPAADLSTSELARLAGWSAAHLHRDFHRVAGETPKAWATRVRLAHAIRLLRESDAPIGEIAVRAGFASHEVLTRTTRRVLRTTPSVLRQATGSDHLEPSATRSPGATPPPIG